MSFRARSAWARRRSRSRRPTIRASSSASGKDRRFFVNLEPAPNAEGILSRLAADLGLPASGAASELEAKIAAACTAAPTLAILDNLETPWRKDTAATEQRLGRLAAIESLRLIITVRGEPPRLPGPGARTLQDVERLDDADTRALFLRHAGDHFAADAALPGLLKALDGHPLSIELRFIFFAISDSGVRAFECALSSRTSSFVHGLP